jgi:hypothetical protein
MSEPIFTVPLSPLPCWEDLTLNEQGWIEFIRVVADGKDPKINLERVRALQAAIRGR